MLEAITQSILDGNTLSAIVDVSQAFQCTPLEYLETLAQILCVAGVMIGFLFSIVLDDVVKYAFRFSRWLCNLLKVHFQRHKKKDRS